VHRALRITTLQHHKLQSLLHTHKSHPSTARSQTKPAKQHQQTTMIAMFQLYLIALLAFPTMWTALAASPTTTINYNNVISKRNNNISSNSNTRSLQEFYECNICFTDQVLANPEQLVQTDSSTVVKCKDVAQAGLMGLLTPEVCELLQPGGLIPECECVPIVTTASPTTTGSVLQTTAPTSVGSAVTTSMADTSQTDVASQKSLNVPPKGFLRTARGKKKQSIATMAPQQFKSTSADFVLTYLPYFKHFLSGEDLSTNDD
jgi:hypothetical protein